MSEESRLFRAHPWHGVSIGENAPDEVVCYIEIVPTDTVKFELDKATGLLKIDRPQKFSNICPTLYGFIPQTYCAEQVAGWTIEKTGRAGLEGDGDPMDICILSEKSMPRGDILLRAIPIGGLRMIDGTQVDDKIIGVLRGDAVYGEMLDIDQCPEMLINRLKHYFLTYKQAPDEQQRIVEITHVFGRKEAHEVISRGQNDYRTHYRKR